MLIFIGLGILFGLMCFVLAIERLKDDVAEKVRRIEDLEKANKESQKKIKAIAVEKGKARQNLQGNEKGAPKEATSLTKEIKKAQKSAEAEKYKTRITSLELAIEEIKRRYRSKDNELVNCSGKLENKEMERARLQKKVESLLKDAEAEATEAPAEGYYLASLYKKDCSSSLLDVKIDFESLLDEARQLYADVQENPPDMVTGTRYDYLVSHSYRVAVLSLFIANGLGLDPKNVSRLGVAAFLHDIGFVKKDLGALKLPETSPLYRKHTTEGAQILTDAGLGGDIVSVALEHHECLDGTGFPDGKTEDQIHLFAKIVHIADTYVNLTDPRDGSKPILLHEAVKKIAEDADKNKVDRECATAFARSMSLYPVGSYVEFRACLNYINSSGIRRKEAVE